MPMTRTASPSRTAQRFRRTGTPPKSGPKRALESVTAAVPGIAKAKSHGSSKNKRRRGGKAGRIAVVGAAAGMAFKNRDKLMSMFRRQGSRDKADAETAPVEAGTRPTAGPADPIRSGNIAPTDPGNRPDITPTG
jgi:hypothetical protein